MRLSKIKLSGFKSFVDPTTINFPSNLIGVVGPNGCGKSNIIDAVRWVLGESSAKTLRGDSMADVIFNGSSNRKPVGQASIELIFDNSDGKIAGPYAGYEEVAVRRVVSRDGTSQYFLNNGRCRRKDITHLLLGTGVGSHGYSIIEQGMISRLVEAKPEELRAFLEEAAGISKYKERRRETEHKIRHTRDNLDRLGDLREELGKQLEHLQRQAKAAERYKVLKAEERKVKAELLVLRLNALRAQVEAEELELRARQLALEAAVTAERSVEAAIEKLRVELHERTETFNRVQGAYYRVGAEIARLEQSIQHRKETVKRHQSDLSETDTQLAEIKGHIHSDQVELEQLDELLSRLHPDLEEANARLRQSEHALKDAERELEQLRERYEQISQDVADTHRTAQVEEARIEQLTAQRERLQKTAEAQRAERATLDTGDLEAGLHALVAAEENDKAASMDAARALQSVYERIQRLREQEDSVTTELDARREQLLSDRGRLSSLEALQEAALGKLSACVDEWLTKHGLAGKPKLAEALEVEEGFERAVETALGGYFQAVDVDGPNTLDALAADLARLGEGGLALFEAPGRGGAARGAAAGARAKAGANAKAAARGAADDAPARHAAPAGLTPLASKIRLPLAAKGLVAGIFVAGSFEAAVKARHGLAAGQSIITPGGVWVTAHAVRIAASDDPQVGVLERGEEIERLGSAVAEAADDVEALAHRQTATREQLEALEAERDTLQLDVTDKQQAYADTRTRLEASRAKLDESRRRAQALDRSLAELDDERARLERALAESRERLDLAQDHRRELSAERKRLETERDRQTERVTDARWAAEQDREQMQEIAIKVESRRSSMESATAALARVETQQQHLLRRRAELERLAATAAEPLPGEEQTLVAKLDERLEVENELNAARRAVETCDNDVREAEVRRVAKQEDVNAAREAADAVRLAVREVQVRAETVAEQFDATGFELAKVAAELPGEATAEAWAESLERIDRRVQRLGAINLAAIDEYTEKSERKQYLDTQFEDLSSALETLEAAIKKIDRETRTRFRDTFDKANEGLSRLFPRLFGGGEAYLSLESDDLLEAGVTIMARPPGKKISTIHLLSGGEKALTAVALVFSIFELNPAPFCLLDEVDAPLDDANVGRFSELVKEMSSQVQFVLITHNKTTMEAMNQLAGVTMQEPGVSRLVVVDIDEAVQLAAM